MMKTASVLINSLCVPCGCRCRYCLLSWNGKTEGAEWERSVSLAKRWLDEEYYAAFPDFKTLSEMYGDKNGDKMYGIRDLFAHYRAQYAKERNVRVYDVTDERCSGSRRY